MEHNYEIKYKRTYDGGSSAYYMKAMDEIDAFEKFSKSHTNFDLISISKIGNTEDSSDVSRDEIAVCAMMGILSNPNVPQSSKIIAEQSYEMADMMIEYGKGVK